MLAFNLEGATSLMFDLGKHLGEYAAEKAGLKAETLVEKLKDATPVDTGRARDGWKQTQKGVENHVPYIGELNAGHSQQAPTHFIEKTIMEDPELLPNGQIVEYDDGRLLADVQVHHEDISVSHRVNLGKLFK